ncbi:MAG TPA: hypothetical protein VGM77_10125 [Gemmatimonadales bacterium]|jgi:hypothetical protein
MQHERYQLGKNVPVTDLRTLRFERYLGATLPPPPAAVSWSTGVRRWPMYLNDRYGDCTCAAVGHMVEAWTASVHQPHTPTDAAVLQMYEHFTPPGPENGCNMLDVLKYWRTVGIDRDRINAFALLGRGSVAQARQAVALFGGCYIGLALPQYVVDVPDLLQAEWTMASFGTRGAGAPDPENGHCVNAVGYDAESLYVVTWGTIKAMSWAFYHAYSDESYAVLSADFLARGLTPAGFNLAQLNTDLAAIGSARAA